MAPRKTPGGGPKPDKLMRDALALELHQEVKLTTGEKIKKLRLVARTLVDNAIDGDTTAARECFDRMDGKVTQSVDATQVRSFSLSSAPPGRGKQRQHSGQGPATAASVDHAALTSPSGRDRLCSAA